MTNNEVRTIIDQLMQSRKHMNQFEQDSIDNLIHIMGAKPMTNKEVKIMIEQLMKSKRHMNQIEQDSIDNLIHMIDYGLNLNARVLVKAADLLEKYHCIDLAVKLESMEVTIKTEG